MKRRAGERVAGLEVPVPGAKTLQIRHAVFDFNGTLALDGALLPGVAPRLRALAKVLSLTVLTTDTYGTAEKVLGPLPVTAHVVQNGRDKATFVSQWRSAGVAAIGNGTNDVPMFRLATLSVAILGPEGLSAAALRSATVVVPNALAALGLLLHSKRVSATLRR